MREFYRLREDPFGATPNYRRAYPSHTHRQALASLSDALLANLGFSLLIAEPGMGKTTLIFKLMDELRDSALFAFLFQTQCNSRELLRALMTDLKLPVSDDASVMHEHLKELLVREAGRRRVVVIVDEAQNLEAQVLETLRLLSDFETADRKLLHIVLAAQPQLADKLASPELIQVQQRIQTVARLLPFNSKETIRCIDYRLRLAGFAGTPLFSPAAYKKIADASQGIPRNINRICSHALLAGCALGKTRIDGEIIDGVLEDYNFASLRQSCSGTLASCGPNQWLPEEPEEPEVDSHDWEFDVWDEPARESILWTPVQDSTFPVAAGSVVEMPFASTPVEEGMRTSSTFEESASWIDLAATSNRESAVLEESFLESAEPIAVQEVAVQKEEREPRIAEPIEHAQQKTETKLPVFLTASTMAEPEIDKDQALAAADPVSRRWRRLTWIFLAAAVVLFAVGIGRPYFPVAEQWIDSELVPQTMQLAGFFRDEADRVRQQLWPEQRIGAASEAAPVKQEQPPAPQDQRKFMPPVQSPAGVSAEHAQPSPSARTNQQANPSATGGARAERKKPSSEQRQLTAASAAADVSVVAQSPEPAHGAAVAGVARYQTGQLIHQVRPEYPPLALQAGAQGEVVVRAEIDAQGHVVSVHPVSITSASNARGNGHMAALLMKATTSAVGKWRYEPALVNDRPVETTVDVRVTFKLNEPVTAAGR